MRKSCAVAFLFLLTISVFADQVTLKNGDRLTGSITKSDGKTLVIKTDYAGDVTVKFDLIQGISTTGDLNVGLSGGKTVVGPVTTSGENLVVTTKAAGTVETPKASVALLRSPAEQAAYEKSLHPGWGEGWAGGVNLGFAVTAGNSETRNLNIAFNGTRTGLNDKLILYENSIYAVSSKLNRVPISPGQTTANSNGGGIRYDRNLTPRMFGFVSGDFFSNSLQDLSLRSILSGGVGYHAIKTDATTLDLLAGLSYTRESFSDIPNPNGPPALYSPSDSSASLTLGDNFTHKIGKSTLLTQSFLIYPGLSTTKVIVLQPVPPNTFENLRVYRFAFNLGTVTKINSWLGWQNSVTDVYVSHPPTVPLGIPRIERNDLQISTGLNFSFKH